MSRHEFPRLTIPYNRMVGSKMIPAPVVLQAEGPTVQVHIGPHTHLAEIRKQQGLPPMLVEGTALIDSGATSTTIDTEVARQLGLQPSGAISSVGIGGESAGFTAACSVNIHGLTVNLPRAHCHDLTKYCKGLFALIGRDILRYMIFHYDGPKGEIYLELPILDQPASSTRARPGKPKRRGKRK